MLTIGALEKAKRYIESHSATEIPGLKIKKLTRGPCITISRETGAGADQVSEKLADFLNQYLKEYEAKFTVFDRNLIEKIIEDHHLPEHLKKLIDEHKYSALDSIASEMFGGQPPVWNLIHKSAETIYQIAQIGNSVIVGRGSNIITSKLKTAFHLRLVAPYEKRVKHIEEIFNMDRAEAEKFIKKSDLDRKYYLKTYFNKNIEDPLLYHLVFNTGLVSYDTAAEMIGNIIIRKFIEYFKK